MFQTAINRRPPAATIIYIGLIIACSAFTLSRNGTWRDEVTIWGDANKKSPGKIRPLNNLGNAVFNMGNYEQAMILYNRALAIRPYHTTWFNISNAYRKMGLIDPAIDALRRAISLNPQNSTYYVNLGNCQALIGRNSEAVESYKKALMVNPNEAKAFYNLANTLEEMGRRETAAHYYEEALRVQPDYHLAAAGRNRVFSALGKERLFHARSAAAEGRTDK